MSGDPRQFVPAVSTLLVDADLMPLLAGSPAAEQADLLREITAEIRGRVAEMVAGAPDETVARAIVRAAILVQVSERAAARAGGVGRRVVNATGVVLHTNLGRAPLGEAAVQALVDIAPGYSVVEMDLVSARRGRRAEGLERMTRLAAGAEAALAVNNNAAAVLLVLSTFARGREVIVSRGELVEIGGSFRIPDVMAWGGAHLREVGTTNRTHLRDYANAINENTAAIMIVHPSNFHIEGFTRKPTLEELVALAREHQIALVEDQGSGYLIDPAELGLPARRTVAQSLEAGVDLVTFSGDKILGGPQAGLIAGRREHLAAMRANPLCRAIRLNRFTITSLEATLRQYVDGSWRDLPVPRMLMSDARELASRATALAAALRARLGEGAAEVACIEGSSKVGGGAFPEAILPTTLVRIVPAACSLDALAKRLRLRPLPIVGRIGDEGWLTDPRTLRPGDDEELIQALAEILTA